MTVLVLAASFVVAHAGHVGHASRDRFHHLEEEISNHAPAVVEVVGDVSGVYDRNRQRVLCAHLFLADSVDRASAAHKPEVPEHDELHRTCARGQRERVLGRRVVIEPGHVVVGEPLLQILKLGRVDVLEAALVFLSKESRVCAGGVLVAAAGRPKGHLGRPVDGSREGQDAFVLQLSEGESELLRVGVPSRPVVGVVGWDEGLEEQIGRREQAEQSDREASGHGPLGPRALELAETPLHERESVVAGRKEMTLSSCQTACKQASRGRYRSRKCSRPLTMASAYHRCGVVVHFLVGPQE